MMLAPKSGHQIAAKVGNPAGLLCRRIWYSVGKSGVLGITEYRQGRPLTNINMEGQRSIDGDESETSESFGVPDCSLRSGDLDTEKT